MPFDFFATGQEILDARRDVPLGEKLREEVLGWGGRISSLPGCSLGAYLCLDSP